ncbi:hypothetical protein ACFO6Y_33350 [Cupriavidus pinatubonensis]
MLALDAPLKGVDDAGPVAVARKLGCGLRVNLHGSSFLLLAGEVKRLCTGDEGTGWRLVAKAAKAVEHPA